MTKRILSLLVLVALAFTGLTVAGCEKDEIDVQRTTTIENVPAAAPRIVVQ
ncbi:MAG: hypothetical protein GXY38_04055 [Planctomycetes bacterium]|jgi:hypothetical protein|nr:hypothetical protein [Planctomycetota bacterium]